MFLPNVSRVMAQIKRSDVVLDVGGWAQPFRRANFVIDVFPYETRGWLSNIGLPASVGEGEECFNKDSWIQRDLCARVPFPFEDKSVDYVVCSHVLEDLRDPLWVCSEMIRIGKRGYIEIPSRIQEFIFDSRTKTVGAPHHRWLISIERNKITFEMKYHLIHKRGLHFPEYVHGLLSPEERVQWLFWSDSFEFQEASIPLGEEDIERRLREFVETNRPAIPSGYRLLWLAAKVYSGSKKLWPKPITDRMGKLWRAYRDRYVFSRQKSPL
jgi:hypothetical protein